MVPKIFVPKKKIAKEARKLLKPLESQFSELCLKNILRGYEECLAEGFSGYTSAEKIAGHIRYSKLELQPFCDELTEYENEMDFLYTGMYLSALVNKIIKEKETILLKLPNTTKKIDDIGSYFCQGTLKIEGDVGDFTGYSMSGGRLIIEGMAGGSTGNKMSGGEIHARKIKSISPLYEKGKIYEYGKKVR